MITCSDKNLPDGRSSNYGFYDTGAAMAQLTVQASMHGLVVHSAQGIDADKIVETYGVPDDFRVCTGVAIGYQGEAETLPDDYARREVLPRERKPVSDLVFTGGFDQTSNIVR